MRKKVRIGAWLAFILWAAFQASRASLMREVRAGVEGRAAVQMGSIGTVQEGRLGPAQEGRLCKAPQGQFCTAQEGRPVAWEPDTTPAGPAVVDFPSSIRDETKPAPQPQDARPAAVTERPAPSQQEEGGAAAPAGGSSHVVVAKGVLRNPAHGFHFPVPRGWRLQETSTDDEMVLAAPSCDDCVLRVLVSPDNNRPLQDAIHAIKEQVAAEPASRVIDEQWTKIARVKAYTIVKEERASSAGEGGSPAGGAAPGGSESKRLLTRYVTFNHGDDRYYLVLRSPSGRFSADEDSFAVLLKRFSFD